MKIERINLLFVGSIVLIATSATANVLLVKQNAALRTRVNGLQSQLQITLNVPLPAVAGTSIAGTPVSFDIKTPRGAAVEGKPRSAVLFVLSPICRFCAANWSYWKRLLNDRTTQSAWQPVFINVGPPLEPTYTQRHELGTSLVFQSVSPETLLDYRLYSTPQTIVLDNTGRARGLWRGVLSADNIAEIQGLLKDPSVSGQKIATNEEVRKDGAM